MYGKISAIIPVYNTKDEFLLSCVNSVIAQTYKNFELIIVDDGSKKETAELCDKIAGMDSRIRVIHQENAGPSIARNTGIQHVRGEYLTFIDSDDTIAIDTWEKSLEKMNATKADCLVFGWYDNSKGYPEKISVSQDDVCISSEEAVVLIASDNDACGGGYPWNKIWDTSSIRANNNNSIPLFDTELFAYEDKEWILRLLEKLDLIMLIPDAFYDYRFVQSSLTNNADSWYRRQYNAYLAYDKILDLFKDKNHKAYCGALNFYFYFGFMDLYDQVKHPSWFGGISRVRKTKKCMYVLCKKTKISDLFGFKRKALWLIMHIWGIF